MHTHSFALIHTPIRTNATNQSTVLLVEVFYLSQTSLLANNEKKVNEMFLIHT